MPYTTKNQFIWNLINNENSTCKPAAEAYISNAKLAGLEIGITQLCKDGFPHAGKVGNRDPKWDRIKQFIASARDRYDIAYPYPVYAFA